MGGGCTGIVYYVSSVGGSCVMADERMVVSRIGVGAIVDNGVR